MRRPTSQLIVFASLALAGLPLAGLAPGVATAQPASAPVRVALDEAYRYTYEQTLTSCVRSQVVKPANFSRTVGAIHRYCDCYAQKLIDTLTPDELRASERDLSPAVRAKADAATAACASLAR